jgi:hypothetical protein
MPSPASGGLGLPKFQRNENQRLWIASKRRTAQLIQSLWKSAGKQQRSDPSFLSLLVQCGWTNSGQKRGKHSTRRWRNQNIADYLKVPYGSDEQLAQVLASRFKALSISKCLLLLNSETGITHYYNAFRPGTLKCVKQHSHEIGVAFKRVCTKSVDAHNKVHAVSSLIESLGRISVAGRHVSLFNGLTPTLSCLDPQCRFPIMNERTRGLLRCIEMKSDTEGMVALSKLIGPAYDVRDAFELDAYAYDENFPKPKSNLHRLASGVPFSDVGLKSEINSIARIAAKKAVITKRHNKLINRLRDYVLWRQKTLKQSKFDGLVIGWKKGRDLLIEAKTASEGPSGRSQIRQAIGQLYDYRFTHMPKNKVDLAVLVPKQPSPHVHELLASLRIELLWFKGKSLTGTISL